MDKKDYPKIIIKKWFDLYDLPEDKRKQIEKINKDRLDYFLSKYPEYKEKFMGSGYPSRLEDND